MGACVESFDPFTLFCPMVTSKGTNFRTGCRINVGIEIFLELDGQTETRIGEGDETGWGMKGGRLPRSSFANKPNSLFSSSSSSSSSSQLSSRCLWIIFLGDWRESSKSSSQFSVTSVLVVAVDSFLFSTWNSKSSYQFSETCAIGRLAWGLETNGWAYLEE